MDERLPPTQSDETLAWFGAGIVCSLIGYSLYWAVWAVQMFFEVE